MGIRNYVLMILGLACLAGCSGSKNSKSTDTEKVERKIYPLNFNQHCDYMVYRGAAKIVEIKKLKKGTQEAFYVPYEIRFSFLPNIKDDQSKRFEGRLFTLFLDKENEKYFPGPEYIKKYNISKGMSVPMVVKIVRSGICSPVICESRQLPSHDLFEMDLPPPIDTTDLLAKSGGNCDYQKIDGIAKITYVTKIRSSSRSLYNYDEYRVMYQFMPTRRMPVNDKYSNFFNQNWTHTIFYKDRTVNPGPQYLKKHKIYKDARFPAQMYLLRNGSCNPYIFKCASIPEDDYAEVEEGLERVKKVILSVAEAQNRKLDEQEIESLMRREPISPERPAMQVSPVQRTTPTDLPELYSQPHYDVASSCQYQTTTGFARIVNIDYANQSGPFELYPYRPIVIKFMFTNMARGDKDYLDPMKVYEWHLERDGKLFYPGKVYAARYALFPGAVKEVNLRYKVDGGACQPYIFSSADMPNDLSEWGR